MKKEKLSFLESVVMCMNKAGVSDAVIIYQMDGECNNTAILSGSDADISAAYHALSDQISEYLEENNSQVPPARSDMKFGPEEEVFYKPDPGQLK